MLLIVWVALCFFWQPPWTPITVNDTEDTFHKVIILSSPLDKPRSLAYEATLLDEDTALHIPPRLTIYLPKDSMVYHPQIGDVVLCKTKFENGRGYSRKGLYAFVEHREMREISILQGKIRILSLRCRDYIEQRLARYTFSPKEIALIESLTLADRRGLTRDQRDAFTDAGAMHVLAVSGLHIGIVGHIATFIFSLGGLLFIPWEKKWLRIIQRIGILSVIWMYAFLTGFPLSVIRSAIMISLLPLGNLHLLSPVRYNRLAAAAFIILFINPNALFTPSFLLSFSAVLALLYFMPYWLPYIPHTNKAIEYGCSMILASVAAQIGTLPWTLYFFGQSANYFLLTNMIVLPLAEILLILCFLSISISFVPFLGPVATASMWLLDKSAWLMNTSVEWVQSLPGATSFVTFNLSLSAILIALIFSASASIRAPKKRKYFYFPLTMCLACAFLILYYFTIHS